MTDQSYLDFLERARYHDDKFQENDDPGFELKSEEEGIEIPLYLKRAVESTYYISDSDEPFVPVSLQVDDGLPDEKSFARIVKHPDPTNAIVNILDVEAWDPRGDYKELVDVISLAAQNSPIHVYRISLWGSRLEYWLVGLRENKILIGAKALAIED